MMGYDECLLHWTSKLDLAQSVQVAGMAPAGFAVPNLIR